MKINRVALVYIVICILACIIFAGPLQFYASASSVTSFETSNVLVDLTSSSVEGDAFDISDYPFDDSKGVEIINLIEYGYSYYANLRGCYGLYLYIYNPQGIDFDVDNERNKIELAISYNAENVPIDYEKFELKFCSKSDEPYKNLFYKFKIVDHVSADGLKIVQRVNTITRRYDVSGFEIVSNGAVNATEYAVGGTYKYSGYAAGLGENPETFSTLQCAVVELETIKLDVHYTNYRSNTSAAGAGHRNQLDSVYFSVPNRFFDNYGRLQKIKAEWYEYRTQNIISLKPEYYNQFAPYVGVYKNYNEDEPGLYANMNTIPHSVYYDYTYNRFLGIKNYAFDWTKYESFYDEKYLSILLNSDDLEVDNNLLKNYIYSYDKSFRNGKLPGRNISADLFIDTVDSGRTRGYNVREFDADNVNDKWDMLSYDSNHSGFQKFLDFGFWAPPTDGDFSNVDPIHIVEPGELNPESLYINEKDYPGFAQFYTSETLANNTPVIFRFAVTDYYSQNLYIGGNPGGSGSLAGYRAQETVFLDFDIITLTFAKNGHYTVIPAVSNPIDIINNPTPPLDPKPWMWPDFGTTMSQIVGILMLVVLAILFIAFFPVVIKVIFWIIKLPFVIVGGIAKGIKKAVSREKIKNKRYK